MTVPQHAHGDIERDGMSQAEHAYKSNGKYDESVVVVGGGGSGSCNDALDAHSGTNALKMRARRRSSHDVHPGGEAAGNGEEILMSHVPVDKYYIVWAIVFLLGVGVLLPWNIFITETAYFNKRVHVKPVSALGKEEGEEEGKQKTIVRYECEC